MKILLLTDIPPCTNFTAGLVLLDLVRFLIKDGIKVVCCSVSDPTLTFDIPEKIEKNLELSFYQKPKEDWGRKKFGALSSLVMNGYHSLLTLNRIAEDISEESKLKDIDLIWNVVQGQSMILLVRKVAAKLKKNYVVQVWDPPEWWLKEFKFDSISRKRVIKEFSIMLRKSETCLAASWEMAEFYSRQYGANCIPVIPGIPNSLPEKVVSANKGEFAIGFAGQIYASQEWNKLIAALDLLKWQYNGMDIRLELFGRSFRLNFSNPANIVVNGWEDRNQVLEKLSKMDLLYCPYFFSREYELVSKLSFPSKLTSYLSTGVPVLVHGPEYASPVKFIKQTGSGYVCESLDPDTISKILTMIMDNNSHARVGKAGYEAYKTYLTDECMKESFYGALGIYS